MKIDVPALSLVVLVGASGSGKSTFARRHFLATEILGSDQCRGLVADNENDQTATDAAFEVLHFVAERRLRLGRLTVVDATNVQQGARAGLVDLARRNHVLPIAIVLALPESLCRARNRTRVDRQFGAHVIPQQSKQLRSSLRHLKKEGFSHIYVLESETEIDAVEVRRVPLWTDRRHDKGPFDIVGDVHGCGDELEALLHRLGYAHDGRAFRHPGGRRLIFVGDLCDRGPRTVDVLTIAMDMVEHGAAFWVPGNHDTKLAKHLQGRQVKISHGLERSIQEIEALVEPVRTAFVRRYLTTVDNLVSHLVFDAGQLVVAHAGMKEEYIGRASKTVREFALYGETTGETDEHGLPVRLDWAARYKGQAHIVYGHTTTPEPQWLNRTINIDQGCVYGGKLTALRWPERELVSIPAAREYYRPVRPMAAAAAVSLQWQEDEVLDLEDFASKHIIPTLLDRQITIRPEHAAAALEVLSRFSVDRRWLAYLPPTMSPSETSSRPGYLEHPAEALAYYRKHGVAEVVCEEKHMGSRAVLVLCRDEAAGLARFGRRSLGACYTRTGRPFFEEAERAPLLERLARALAQAGFWDALESSWVVLDCEVMPWNMKAQELLRTQYGAVGVAATLSLAALGHALDGAVARGLSMAPERARVRARQEAATRFVQAYGRYCWEVRGLDDIQIAPFHLLAAEGRTFFDRDHVWHMETLAKLAEADRIFRATRWRLVRLADDADVEAAIAWWLELTENGGEGFVVKPRAFIARAGERPLQPAVKCRGREYLRIIYGPDYTEEHQLVRLRQRGLGAKRSLALREFALGLEGLERFVRKEPLRRVHECAFGVLALESEPVDPRL